MQDQAGVVSSVQDSLASVKPALHNSFQNGKQDEHQKL